MAKIFPFRAVYYNPQKVELNKVVTQPYDKIDDKLQDEYHKRNPNNVVRIIKSKDEPGDTSANNKYTRAAKVFNEFLSKETIIRHPAPALYAYYQTYKDVTGEWKTRKAFVGLLELEEFGKGKVHAHEKTLPKPKQDRLSLLKAMNGTFLEQIFMLYSDTDMTINKIMDSVATKTPPLLEAKDDYGEIHKVWAVTAPEMLREIQKTMAKKDTFIADGHHRYETACNFKNEMKAAGKKCKEPESYNNFMITFVNMDDEGLTIFPTHRLVKGLPNFSYDDLAKTLAKHFSIKEYEFKNEPGEKAARTEFLEDLRIEGQGAHCFGLLAQNQNKYALLTLKNEETADAAVKENFSADWKRLDVSILHSVILEPMLGLDKTKVESEGYIEYIRYYDEAFNLVRSGKCQAGFLMNSVKVQQVKKIASKGERMPQKSTDFYPKLLSGLVGSMMEWT